MAYAVAGNRKVLYVKKDKEERLREVLRDINIPGRTYSRANRNNMSRQFLDDVHRRHLHGINSGEFTRSWEKKNPMDSIDKHRFPTYFLCK